MEYLKKKNFEFGYEVACLDKACQHRLAMKQSPSNKEKEWL